jgi:hypothetical protein
MFERKLNALQIKVSLAEINPSVWRRLIVPAAWHLGELHLAIQAAFNWWNYHLHEFRIGGLRYGDPGILEEGSFEDDARVFDEREVRLRDFSREDGISFSYIYDLGDNWVHTVEIEKHVSLDVAPRIAACVAGERARPPEDVGGVSGYENFLAIMADPTDDEHIDTKSWCGGHFDRDWFDLAMTDKDVRNALRANVRRRMHQPKPRRTSHQIN